MRSQKWPFEVGEIIQAKVTEVQSDEHYLVSYKGNLIRVKSNIPLKVNQMIELLVQSLKPVLLKPTKKASARRFDRFV